MDTRNAATIARGDVIASEKFVFGECSSAGRPISVGLDRRHRSEGSPERTTTLLDDGTKVIIERPVDLYRYDRSDETRKNASFVVEETKMQGGCEQAGYPDGQHVTARRLNADGTYNPTGELICFYMSGFFMNKIEEVELRWRMDLRFVRSECASLDDVITACLPDIIEKAEKEHAWASEMERLVGRAAPESTIVAPTSYWVAAARIWCCQRCPEKKLRFEVRNGA